LCKRDYTQPDIEVFKTPIHLRVDVRRLSNEYLLQAIGNVDKKYMIAKVPLAIGDVFEVGDRCYIDTEPNVNSDEMCLDADYRVQSVVDIGKVTEIMFEGLL
jgi:hypothetical protein